MADPRVNEAMSSPVESIGPDAPVSEAAEQMRDDEINALLVRSSPPGIVTSTDILDVVATRQEVTEMSVADLMTESVETVPPSIRLSEAAAMMTTYEISHLPVVEDGDYVGMISSTDVTRELA
jgi:CBS domain-containing protein